VSLIDLIVTAFISWRDVVSIAEILCYLDQLPADLFDLPIGRRSPATPIKEAAE
jgi:hypothetical protein